MDSVSVDQLSKDHLKTYWAIMAYEADGEFCREVWCSFRLLPFTSAGGPANRIPVLYVPVQDLNEAGIQPLIDRLKEIDPAGDRRIVLEVLGEG